MRDAEIHVLSRKFVLINKHAWFWTPFLSERSSVNVHQIQSVMRKEVAMPFQSLDRHVNVTRNVLTILFAVMKIVFSLVELKTVG